MHKVVYRHAFLGLPEGCKAFDHLINWEKHFIRDILLQDHQLNESHEIFS